MLSRFLCAAVVLCLAASMVLAEPARKPRVGKTTAAAEATSATDVGFGHKIQARWWHGSGWGFTLSEMYALFALEADSQSGKRVALSAFLALKLAEAISVWVSASPPRPRPITQTRYVAGGVVGMTLGFGSGHLIQGRWWRGGWPYAVSQALSIYMMAAPCKSCKDTGAFSTLPLAGFMLLLVSKVLETISIWATLPQEYRVTAAEMGTAPTVTLAPIVQGRGLGLLLAKAL